MKLSYNWIKDYLKTDLDPHSVAEILTEIGLEIEETEEWCSVPGGLEGIVIGEVLTSHKHPDADKLTVNTVRIGNDEILHIVCGAPNVAAGQKVPVALAGAIVSKGDEKFEIKKSKIRGQLSEGMICAEDELGLGNSHEGIMVLDPSAIPGTRASEYFKVEKDFIFGIGLTPNRIDSGSHFGVARDLAAYLAVNKGYSAKPALPDVSSFKPDNTRETFEIEIKSKDDCRRYSGVNIFNVKIGESPEWLKNRLRAIGLNPINNVVDITNFVQFEVGQPLHAFDADRIEGKKVIIGNVAAKTKFRTLDNVDRELSSRDLMICNEKEGMCIAGVFGGTDSGVTSATKNIFLESAYFNPVTIRKTARRHGLHTDASYRFERGADPNITVWALRRAALMIKDLAGGELAADLRDVYPVPLRNETVTITYKNVDRLIGKKIERDTIRKILGMIDIKIITSTNDTMTVEIPAYKVDVKKEADVIEEILRIYGYNNIEIGNHVNSTLTTISKPDREKLVNTISDMLSSNGFAEIMCNSLVPGTWFENNEDFKQEEIVKLANPLSSDLNTMRLTLLYGGLSSIAWNINRQNTDLRLYEFGNCYFFRSKAENTKRVENYFEKTDLDLFITGKRGKHSWNNAASQTDFYTVKSWVEMVLARLGLQPENLTIDESPRKYFSESLTYSIKNQVIAEVGKIARKTTAKFDIDQDVYYGHIEWSQLMKLVKHNSIIFKELPKYPQVRRDLALLVDSNTRFSQVRSIAMRTEKNILKEVGLFDVYEHESLGKNKKSYAVSFILQDEMKTLTEKAIDKVMESLIKQFEKELGAQVRR
ncbi:MAG: phenylalanine--tRNA ligase subunit beta [Bacteroidales bacterium]